MNKLLITLSFLSILACNNPTVQDRNKTDSTDLQETQKPISAKALKTPFKYECYGKMNLKLVDATEAGFTHQRNEGMPYAGEILFEGKCDEMHYYLFFGVGDIFHPYVDVYENKTYQDRISIYTDNHGCGADAGYEQNETTFFQPNGKIFSVSKEEVYQIDSINFDPIDSTRKITYDTLILDLKDWCVR